jgi:signal transduction histidine kinase
VIGVYRQNKDNWVWLLFSADPILDENNEVIQVISSFVDISERKKLQQKLIDEEIDKHKLITKATIEGQEKERKEIGKELHDSIGQQLTTTKLYLDLAKSTADEATAELVCLATKSVSDVINDVRTISYSLVPPSLGDLGLIESIKDLYESLNIVKSISIDFYYDSFREELLTDNLKLTLFRIFQEHMNNIVKYAQATNVIIHLDMELDMILLEISDDGIGFDLEKVKRGLGLMNISNRVHLFNGKALVKSEPGKGCTLVISIPIPVPVAK